MANNRMYLRCRTCGDTLFLGKTFGGGYYTSNIYYDGKPHKLIDNDEGEPDAFLGAFNKFLEKHAFCIEGPNDDEGVEPKFTPKDVRPENRFEIGYEFYYNEEEKAKCN